MICSNLPNQINSTINISIALTFLKNFSYLLSDDIMAQQYLDSSFIVPLQTIVPITV